MIIHMPPPNIDPLFLLSSFKKSRKSVRENEVPGQTSKYMYIKIRHGRGEEDFQKLKLLKLLEILGSTCNIRISYIKL